MVPKYDQNGQCELHTIAQSQKKAVMDVGVRIICGSTVQWLQFWLDPPYDNPSSINDHKDNPYEQTTENWMA